MRIWLGLLLLSLHAHAEPCGMAVPLQFENGRTKMVCGSQYINQCFMLFLMTQPGERIMRPDYGFNRAQYVFRNMNAETQALFHSEMVSAVTAYFPWIRLKQTHIGWTSDQVRLSIDLEYEILESGAHHRYRLELQP